MKIVRKELANNREVKLSFDYKLIEELTEKYLKDYDIDNKIETWIEMQLISMIDFSQVKTNLATSRRNIKLQFTAEFFHRTQEYCQMVISRDMEKEIERVELTEGPLEADRLKRIFDNIMDPIPLTMFETGVQRMTLVSYHYLVKVVSKLGSEFMEKYEIKNTNGTKNPSEIFINELYHCVANVEELTKFTLTLKSLIDQWLIKYNNKTKIGEFYYDILMITPEYIVEKILKYMLFTAIRNKNPFTLRAIFSSYLTLIHKNLFSFYATNLTKVKFGYFKQLEGLFTENFDLIFEQGSQSEPKHFIMNSMIFSHLMKHKKLIRANFNLLDDEYIQHFFEPNYFDAFAGYNSEMPFLDWMHFYSTCVKFTKSNDVPEAQYFKINGSFFKKNTSKKTRIIITKYLNKHMWEIFFDKFKDEATVETIFDSISKDLVQKLNMNFYLNEDFSTLEFTQEEHEAIIEKFILLFKKSFVI